MSEHESWENQVTVPYPWDRLKKKKKEERKKKKKKKKKTNMK